MIIQFDIHFAINRLLNYIVIVLLFKECISKSAIQTKFESHAVQGMQTTSLVRAIMENIEAKSKMKRYEPFVNTLFRIYSLSIEHEIK